MRFFLIFILFFINFSPALWAKTINYDVVKDQSDVGFSYQFSANTIKGTFPKYTANVAIDFEKPANSHVSVTLNTATSKAGFVFATQAMRSKKMLDVGVYPDIEFASESITPNGNTVIIKGLVTVRGITKPLALTAKFFRASGSLPTERDTLRMHITGALNRNDFGVSGFPNYVGDMLGIDIDVLIKRK